MDAIFAWFSTKWELALTIARPMIFEPLRPYAVGIHLLVLGCCVALVYVGMRLSARILAWMQTNWQYLVLVIGGLLIYWNFSTNYMPAEFALGPQLPANRLIAAPPSPHAQKRQLPAVIIVEPPSSDDEAPPLQTEPEEEAEDEVENVIELPSPPPPPKKPKPQAPPPPPVLRRRRP